MKKCLLSLFCGSALSLGAFAKQKHLSPTQSPLFNQPEILSHIRFLSDDALKGRLPSSEGDFLAQKYIAAQFERLGLKPMGDNQTYFQPFNLLGVTTTAPEKFTFTSGKKSVSLKLGEEVIGAAGVQEGAPELKQAELVFVGYGIQAPEYQWDDFKGKDLSGKILVFLNNDPSTDDKLFAGKRRLYYGRWRYKYEQAARQRAAGALIIHTDESAGYGWKVVQTSWSGEEFALPLKKEDAVPLKGWVTEKSANELFTLGGQSLADLVKKAQTKDFSPVSLGVTLSVKLKTAIRTAPSGNVLGLLEGSDPKLKNEVVMYMAHHDHLGECGDIKKTKDIICNGAMDNASGVSAILAMARAYSEQKVKPKRSILFAAVGAEEQGLLGSQYYSQNPTIAPGLISAVINIDGLNVWGKTKDLVYIGKGKTNLDALVEGLAKSQGRVVKGDQFPEKGFFYRSDQFNLAKVGVPAAFFETGVDFVGKPDGWGKKQLEAWEDANYHQPSDEIKSDWDLSGALEDITLMYNLGMMVAQQKDKAEWVPGDEFAAAREKAIKSVK